MMVVEWSISLVHIDLDFPDTINAEPVAANHYQPTSQPMPENTELINNEIVELYSYLILLSSELCRYLLCAWGEQHSFVGGGGAWRK
jgi:hypothetical protein